MKNLLAAALAALVLTLGAPAFAESRFDLIKAGGTSTSAATVTTADGKSSPTALPVAGYPYLYNNVTWDRFRSVILGTDSVGTGIAAAGLLAQYDDVATSSVTENRFANLRVNADRELLVGARKWPGPMVIESEATGYSVAQPLKSATASFRLTRVNIMDTANGVAYGSVRETLGGTAGAYTCTGKVYCYWNTIAHGAATCDFGPRGADAALGACIAVESGTVRVNIAGIVEATP